MFLIYLTYYWISIACSCLNYFMNLYTPYLCHKY